MDPDEVLSRLRDAVKEWEADAEGSVMTSEQVEERLDTVLDLFDALDAWITAGGFIPRAWEENR